MTPTVFVVDDDPAVRDAMGLLLESAGRNVALFESAEAFLAGYEQERTGCLILDIRMPQMDGLELQAELGKRGIELPIIFLTGHGDVPTSVRAMKGGATDFLEKPFREQVLLERIDEAIETDLQRRREKLTRDEIHCRFELLTPREHEVMSLVIGGKSNKEVAQALRVSHRTIEIHRARVMEKVGAKSVAELLSLALACGEWTPPTA
ncbi:MAG: response regulator transcription factor [Chromatiales bacterium]|nr:response regulator transcription factor [Chromatiales bacterium]